MRLDELANYFKITSKIFSQVLWKVINFLEILTKLCLELFVVTVLKMSDPKVE